MNYMNIYIYIVLYIICILYIYTILFDNQDCHTSTVETKDLIQHRWKPFDPINYKKNTCMI